MVWSTRSVSNSIRIILLHQKLKSLINCTSSPEVTQQQPVSATLSGARATAAFPNRDTKLRAQQVDYYQLCTREEEWAMLKWMGLKSIFHSQIQLQHPYDKIQIQKTHRHRLISEPQWATLTTSSKCSREVLKQAEVVCHQHVQGAGRGRTLSREITSSPSAHSKNTLAHCWTRGILPRKLNYRTKVDSPITRSQWPSIQHRRMAPNIIIIRCLIQTRPPYLSRLGPATWV